MPIVLSVYEIREKIFLFMLVKPLMRDTPNSSGSGDAIKNPANVHKIYFLTLSVRWLSDNCFIFWNSQCSFNLSNSSWNDMRMKSKIKKSDSIAPTPASGAARKMLTCGASETKNPTANGAVKPYEKSRPARNIDKYPCELSNFANSIKKCVLKRMYEKMMHKIIASSFGYCILSFIFWNINIL